MKLALSPIEIGEVEFPTSLTVEFKFEGAERGSKSISSIQAESEAWVNIRRRRLSAAKSMLRTAEISDGANFMKLQGLITREI